jgi:hypothetical protein
MSDLFEIPESLSPRLAWLRDHGLTLKKLESGRWECSLDENNCGRGDSQDEACIDFCLKTQLPHWTTP